MTEPLDVDSDKGRRLVIWVLYTSPFSRITGWLWKIDKADPDVADEDLPHVGRFRDWLAVQFDKLDTAWRNYYANRGKYPPERWRNR